MLQGLKVLAFYYNIIYTLKNNILSGKTVKNKAIYLGLCDNSDSGADVKSGYSNRIVFLYTSSD